MTVRSATKAVLKIASLLGLTVACVTFIVALAGFASPAIVTWVSLVVATIMLLAAIAYYAASQAALKQKVYSHESKHAT